jgi:ATP-binding cassette subfamily F protein 3
LLLSVRDLRKAFGPDQVLKGVTFRVERREKLALVGRNGTGKTTLLKMLTGDLEPDTGSVTFSRGCRIGYLRQEAKLTSGRTVLEEAQASVEERLHLQARLDELTHVLEGGNATADDLDEYALIHEHFEDAEAYSTERDVRVVLSRMGFEESEFDRPVEKLSGGERTRLGLARLLLEEPDLLILDEPTNHLDLQATEWIERWVRGYHGAVLLVSHDRTFLEATADRVIDLRNGQVTSWPGPFNHYLELKRLAEIRQAEVASRQSAEIAKMDEFVRRFMNSQRTAQARGRLKLMNRLIESRVQAPTNDKGMKAGFGEAKRSGDKVFDCQKLKIGFGDLTLINGLDWTVRYQERWGIIGENGAGKSTLIKVALELLPALSGSSRLGAGVSAGYFAQDAELLDPDDSPLDLLTYECGLAPDVARNLLGRFLITGDDVFRPIKTLSGGEKNKLSLARLTVLNPNLLVLDEPTNHLDMDSREALAGVLKEYTGTLLLVSHDRWLLEQVTDHILDVRKSGSIQFLGGYTDYRRGGPSAAAKPNAKGKARPSEPQPEPEPTLSPRELSKELQRVARLVEDSEAHVAKTESALAALEAELANLPPDGDVFALTRRHGELQEQLQGAMSAWEELSERQVVLEAKRS